MRFLIIPAFFLLVFSWLSCTGKTPIAPGSDSDSSDSSLSIGDIDENSLGIFGVYEVGIDESLSDYSIKPYPARKLALGEQFLGDITAFMTSVFCRDCAKIDGIALGEEGTVDVSISVRHPFNLPVSGPASSTNRLDLHLFDVEGIVVTNEGTNFPDAEVMAQPGILANADGYSGIFDSVMDQIYPSDNNLHPYKIFSEDSSEGNFDPQSLTTGFADPYAPFGHNVFPQGSYYRSTIFKFNPEPGESITFILVLTASYGVSAKFDIPEGQPGNRLTPRYFLPRFNRHEPWKVKVDVPPFLNFLTSGDPGQTAEVRIDVWDWQDGKPTSSYWHFNTSRAGEFDLSSDIKTIKVYVPSLMTTPVIMDGSLGTGTNPKRFVTKIRDELGAPLGTYWGLACAIDELDSNMSLVGFKRDGKTPFLYDGIRTYQFFPVDVNSSSIAVPENPVDVTPAGLNGIATDVIFSENLAFVSVGVLGIMILDVSNPAAPKFVGSFDTYGNAGRMAYNSVEKLLYIADGAAGLSIINVNNPSSPSLKGSFDIVGLNDVRDVVLYGGYAYLGDGEAGIAIVDVRDPTLPSLAGNYTVRPNIRALAMKGTLLYKLDETDGLEILSLSNPENPVSINGLIIVGSKKDIYISGSVAAILLSDRMVTADLANPLNPVLKGTISLTPSTESVHLISGFAFVANGMAGIKAISIGDLSSPYIVAGYDTSGYAKSCVVSGEDVYVGDGDTGVVVLSIKGGKFSLKSRYLTSGMTCGIAVKEENVFITSGYSGIKSVNITFPDKAYIDGFANTPGYALDCDSHGNALFVTDSASGLAVVSIANPLQPAYLNNIQFPAWENWYAYRVKVNGGYAALWGPQESSDFPDLILLNITNEFIPVYLGSLVTSRDFYDISFASGYIFAAAGLGGVATVNIANPSDPEFVALYANGKYGTSVEGGSGNVYAMFQDNGMEVLSSADPENLSVAGDVFTSGASFDVCLSDKYAYVSDLDGLVIIDVSDSANPYVLSTHPTPGAVSEIVVRGNYAFVACREGGLRIIKLW